jgi:hypothetical protein
VNATNDGVILLPNSFGMISTLPFLKIPTQEYVVPKSIPTTGPSTIRELDGLKWVTFFLLAWAANKCEKE